MAICHCCGTGYGKTVCLHTFDRTNISKPKFAEQHLLQFGCCLNSNYTTDQ